MILKHRDQIKFADLSHDFNPMHCDEILARRLIYGEPVVHGINAMIHGIVVWSRELNSTFLIKNLKCRFNKPLYLNQKIEYKISSVGDVSIISISQNQAVRLKIRLEVSLGQPSFIPHRRQDAHTSTLPDNKTLDQLRDFSKVIDCSIDKGLAEEIYGKSFIEKIGFGQLAELVSYSRIVGMHTPGMNSIFSELHVEYNMDSLKKNVEFKVSNVDDRFNIINIQSLGPSFAARLTAFYRPVQVTQKSIESLKCQLNSNEFGDQRAVIIGGSRGLGEYTAKCLGYGDAEVLITYANGKEDTRKVVSDIKTYNKKVMMQRLDVCNLSKKDLQVLIEFNPTHIYYYATPFIFRGIRGQFSKDLYGDFLKFYVDAFKIIVETMAHSSVNNQVKFLYPSSIALDDKPQDMLEYTRAKTEGEALCKTLESLYENIKIYNPRLPRMETDQTVSLATVQNEDPMKIIDTLRLMRI